ncbi:MAG: PAS domain-containing protein [Desulfovibrio sp.]|jgi:two-component system sensor histidine kinase HydH|nr:PAS domain-containing protein [Desulfovibrio sp.]
MRFFSSAKSSIPPRGFFSGISPWLIVGAALILGLAVALPAFRSAQRDKEYLTQNLAARAEALIWALEAGPRSRMGREQGPHFLLQALLEETAKQSGIVFMAVVDADGIILAHSDPQQIGANFPGEMPRDISGAVSWRLRDMEGNALFEVYRRFAPLQIGRHHHRDEADGRCKPPAGRKGRIEAVSSNDAKNIAFVGFDSKPLENALAADYRNGLLLAAVTAALGLVGFISLFWAYSYRQSRRLLKDTQALASEVVTGLPIGLLTSDSAGFVNIINAAALDILGLDADKTIGAPLAAVPGPDWQGLAAALSRSEKVFEKEIVLPPDKFRHVSLSASQIRNDDGIFLGNLFILRDIGEVKRLQEEAKRNERLTALGNLAAGVAHEIRNPLSSIKGIATYIAVRMPSGGPEEEAARTMIVETDRLNRVVSELLEFARPGAMKVAPEDVNKIVADALRLADTDLKAKNIAVTFARGDFADRAPVNAERLTQALLNLILNAVQAMENEGRLRIAIETAAETDRLIITVEDTGAGIPDDILPSIFTPYFTTRKSGTGLGLSIVHKIVEGHGGSIAVKSRVGEGSAFVINLPLK